MSVPGHLSSRTRFILRHGVVPWGIVIGGVIAAVGVLSDFDAFAVHSGAMRALAALVIAWALWAAIAGWAIGAYRWNTRTVGPSEHRNIGDR